MNASMRIRLLLAAVVTVFGLAVLEGLVAIGPPDKQRQRQLDERRVGDLTLLVRQLHSYREQHRQLPPDLSTLAAQPGVRPPTDPQTGQAYEYAVIDAGRYRLCADFARDLATLPARQANGVDTDWAHGAGHTCFERALAPARSGE